MIRPLATFFLGLLMLPLLASCVSVKLSSGVEKAKGVVVPAPGGAFEDVRLLPADRAWKSARTGNTISYFTECSSTLVPLERMRDDYLSNLPESKLVRSENLRHDGREALSSVLEGVVEGIPVKVSLFLYQKSGCRYSLVYTARSSLFDQETAEFSRFREGFSAP